MKTNAVWILVALTLLGGVLRFYNLGEKSLWSDEIATIASAMGNSVDPNAPLWDSAPFDPVTPQPARIYQDKATTSNGAFAFDKTVDVLQYNVHPPFFFMVMNAVIHVFGFSEAVLRFLPALFGVLCIPMMFLLGRRIGGDNHGTELGLLAATMMALSGYQITHSQDARQYTLLILLALTSMWLMLRCVQSGKRQRLEWLGITVCSVIGLYTQYFYGLFVIFLYAYGLIQQWGRLHFIKGWVVSGLGVLLLFMPWLPMLLKQLSFAGDAGHYTDGLWKPLQLPERLWRVLNEFVVLKEKMGKLLPVFILALFGWSVVTHQKNGKESTSFWSPVLTLSLLWVGVILGGQIVFDLFKDTHTATIRRYTLLASPAYYLLLAYLLLNIKLAWRWVQPVMVTALIALLCWNTGRIVLGDINTADSYKLAATHINENRLEGDVVVVNRSGAIAVGMAHYLESEQLMVGLNAGNSIEFDDSPFYQQQLQQAMAAGQVQLWVVFSHAAGSTKKRLDTYLTDQGYALQGEEKFPGVRVKQYQRL